MGTSVCWVLWSMRERWRRRSLQCFWKQSGGQTLRPCWFYYASILSFTGTTQSSQDQPHANGTAFAGEQSQIPTIFKGIQETPAQTCGTTWTYVVPLRTGSPESFASHPNKVDIQRKLPTASTPAYLDVTKTNDWCCCPMCLSDSESLPMPSATPSIIRPTVPTPPHPCSHIYPSHWTLFQAPKHVPPHPSLTFQGQLPKIWRWDLMIQFAILYILAGYPRNLTTTSNNSSMEK